MLLTSHVLACSLYANSLAIGCQEDLIPRPAISEGETISADQVDVDDLSSWVRDNAQPAVDMLVDLFEDRDVIMLGEVHALRDHAGFVARALPSLYEQAGLRAICSEFLRASETARVRALVEADEWDDEAAVDLMRHGPWPTWGWREYVDIMHSVWRINAEREDGSPPLMFVGIDDDWTQFEMLEAGRLDSFNMKLRREKVLHQSTMKALTEYGPKVLVHIGAAHAVRHGIRISERLHNDLGDRVDYVILHHDLRGRQGCSPIVPLLDRAIENGWAGDLPIGFPIRHSPLARVRDPALATFAMLGPAAAFEDFAPHLIYVAPPDSLSKGTWIEGFITESRFEEALEVTTRLGMIEKDRQWTPSTLDALLAKRLASGSSRPRLPQR